MNTRKKRKTFTGRYGGRHRELIQSIVEKPKVQNWYTKKRKLTDEMIQKIQEHLEENLRKTKGIRETDENSGRYTYLFRIRRI